MCGEMIMPARIQIDKEPEFWTAKCPHCLKIIEVRRDSVTRKLNAKKAGPISY
jgi:hypothetical protein